MEAKLREYRRKEKRKHLWANSKKFLLQFVTFNFLKKDKVHTIKPSEPQVSEVEKAPVVPVHRPIANNPPKEINWRKLSIGLFLWVLTYSWFIYAGFGTVFLIVSMILAVCFNTRTEPKEAGEISAYSVFNPNCEAIDGTLKAEHLEREIGYRKLWDICNLALRISCVVGPLN